MREGIAEEAANSTNHINPWAAKFGQGNHFNACDAAIFGLPNWPHAQQGQHLGNIIAIRAHGASAPNADANAARVAAFFPLIAPNQIISQVLTNLPSRCAWQRTRIDCIEIAACWQHMSHAASWRSTWPRWNIATIQAMQQAGNFGSRTFMQVRDKLGTNKFQGRDERLIPSCCARQ